MSQATFSGNSSYQIDVDARLVSQSGLTSTIYWRILVIKNGSTGHSAWGNNGSSGWADSSQGGGNDLWVNGNMQFNFQNGSMSGTFTIAEGTFQVQHNADGTAGYFVNGGLTLTGLGAATAGTGWRALPSIQTARVPDAPRSAGFGERTQTSIQYWFIGNYDGGTPVREWQALYRDASINGPQISYWSTGGTNLTGLLPGRTYNFWSRGRNDIGWGPWSEMSSARTLAGARVRHGGAWKEAIPYVKHNGAWRLAQPYSKVNGVWRKSI